MNSIHVRKVLPALGAVALLAVVSVWGYKVWRAYRAQQPSQTLSVEGGTISVPEGFTIQKVAGEELTQYPMLAALDERGRLFVTESSGKNVSGKKMAEIPECRISVLEDTDGDGRFDRTKVFADQLSLPMGVLWRGQSLYVASPPDFVRLDDADNDGVSERREVILTGWNVLNTASLHGPFFGPDGWMYLTHGRHGYKIQTKEGQLLEGLASRIWRSRADGTGLERVVGGGFDNPVELIFTAAGEMIGTMTYFTDPQAGQRDALLHYVEGGVYPKPHPAIAEFKRTGDLMPVMTKFARIAPSGLMQYRGKAFGEDFQGNLFTAQFNPHRVQRHKLFRDGATFRTEDSDFITSTDPDFHPTDILEDADGSLILLETGGWYVDACPLSKIHKGEKRGAIYRIRKTNAPNIADPRGDRLKLETLPPAELAKLLEDARPTVRDRSLELLVAGGEKSVAALIQVREQSGQAEVRCAAVFALGRIATAEASKAVRAALDDADFQVRIAAAHVVGLSKDAEAVQRLSQMVKNDEPPARRNAATALGQIGDHRAVAALLTAAADAKDRFIEHAIIYSLIQLKDQAALIAALKSPAAGTRKAALIALDQADESLITASLAASFLGEEEVELRKAGLWVFSHHAEKAEWAGAVLSFLRGRLRADKFDGNEADSVRDVLPAFVADAQVQALIGESLAESLNAENAGRERQLFLLEVIERCSLKQLPEAWQQVIARRLKASENADAQIRARTLAVIRSRRIATLDDELRQIAANAAESVDLRLTALSALISRAPKLDQTAYQFLLETIAPERDPALRLSAAQNLGQAELDREQLLRLAKDHLPKSDSLTLLTLLDAFRKADDEETGRALVTALSQPEVNLEAIGGKRLEQVFQNFPDGVKAASKTLLNRFAEEEAAQLRKLRELEPLLTAGGDVGAGRNVFFGKRAACSSCHTIGLEGGRVGPDLTSIGAIRSGHDILEAIVFPNATFVPGHEPRRVTTKSTNQIYTGVINDFESTRDAIVLMSGPNDKIRIPRDDIASIKASQVSLMPEGFAAQLTQKELTDLLAFLKAQK